MNGKSAVFIACLLFSMPVARADTSSITISGFSGFEFGQVVRGWDASLWKEMSHQWLQNLRGGFTMDARLGERVRGILSLEVLYRNFYPMIPSYPESERLNFLLYPHHIEATYTLGNEDKSPLQIGIGYFPFKYCEHARNLGEYLFRSGTYPPYVTTEFDTPYERLMGLRLESNLGLFKQNLLLTSSTVFPLYDYSLSYLVSLNVPNIISIGSGIGLHRFFSVDNNRTSPKSTDPSDRYINGADTLNYTFKGVKLIAHFSFDPKGFFPSDIFGSEDLILYGEGAILGLENYPVSIDSSFVGYENINNRIPRMFGFNIPTFKLLDVFAVEAEFFGSKFSSTLANVFMRNLPIPDPSVKDNHLDNWKWSLFAKKTFGKRYSIIAQIANDHLRVNANDVMHHQLWEEVLQKPGDWFYMIKQRLDF